MVIETGPLAVGPTPQACASKLAQDGPAGPFSLELDGATGFAEVPGTTALSPSGDWTVELWFKDADPNGFDHDLRYLINKGDGVDPESPFFILLGFGNILVGARSAGVNHPLTFNLSYARYAAKIWQH